MDFFNGRQSQWGKPVIRQNCVGTTGSYGDKYFNCAVQEGPNGGAVRCMNAAGDANTQLFYWKDACKARPEETSWKGDKSGIGAVCHNGCKYTDSLYAGSPTGHLYTASGETCRTDDLAPPETAEPGEG
ncbi:hypothetical protein N5C47_15080, partial [Stenotrophomonas maltophilia]|nr:hypothetical protein [Stenotrophomonas maltophilia]